MKNLKKINQKFLVKQKAKKEFIEFDNFMTEVSGLLSAVSVNK
jgi:hypothetical protein